LYKFSVSFTHKRTTLRTLKIVILYLVFCTVNLGFTYAQNLNLIIKGKDSLETTVIDSLNYKKRFLDFVSLKSEIESQHLKLQKLGFIENKLISNDKKNDSIYVAKFSLNKKYYTIYVYYDKNLLSKEILESISNKVTSDYFITAVSKTEDILNYINSKIAEDGQPFASLNLINLKKKDDFNIQAELIIVNDKKRSIDNIIVKGYEDFPKSFIKHFFKIKTGDDFNLKAIKEKTEILNTLRFANQIKPPEILFTKDTTTVYLYLEKTKSNNFDGFLGFGTNESTNKIEFSGYLNLNLINNLNYGESFNLVYKSDENEQKTFEAHFNLPYIFGSAVGTELALNIFKKDSTYTTVDQSASLFYQINDKQKISIGIEGVQSNNLLNDNSSETIQDFNSFFYNLGYEYVKKQHNNLLFPNNFVFDIKIGLGSREFKTFTEKQTLFNLNTFKIFNLNTKNSIYLRLHGAVINSDSFLTNELVRFGGIKSIRGFEENSLFASLYSVLNTEYRYQLNNTIYVHSIFDAAYFENDITQAKEKLFAFGIGFGINTKTGLLKFNYANGKSKNQKFKFSDSKIHLSLSAIF
jgi:outer membrane protein assembly factor BamA